MDGTIHHPAACGCDGNDMEAQAKMVQDELAIIAASVYEETITTRNSVICNHHVCNWDATACRMQLSLVFYATIMDFCSLFRCVCNYGATMITFILTFG
jgi:hypothetical protein